MKFKSSILGVMALAMAMVANAAGAQSTVQVQQLLVSPTPLPANTAFWCGVETAGIWHTYQCQMSAIASFLTGSNNTWTGSNTFSGGVTLTPPLPPPSGGTGQASYTSGDLLYASGVATLSPLHVGSAGQVLTVSGGAPVYAAPVGQPVASVAALRAGTFTASILSLEGYYAVGGFGGGTLTYVSTDTTTADNGCSIFVDAGGHRYYRTNVPTPFPVAWCGVYSDHSHNDTTAWQNAFNLGVPVIGVGPNTPASIVSSGLTFDTTKTSLDCNGGAIDASGMSSGNFLTLTSTATNGSVLGLNNNANVLQRCYIAGPTPTAGVDFVHVTPTTIGGSPWANGLRFRNLSIIGFNNDFQLQNGSFDIAWDSIEANVTGSFLDLVGTQAENLSMRHIFLSQLTGSCFNDHNSNAGADIYAYDVSCDAARAVVAGGPSQSTAGTLGFNAYLYVNGLHIEAMAPSSNTIINIAGGGSFIWDGGIWAQQTSLGYTACNDGAAATGAPGIQINHVIFGGASLVPYGTDAYWCDGTGPFKIKDSIQTGNTRLQMSSRYDNRVPSFANPNTGAFTSSGGTFSTSATVPSGTTPTATASLSLVSTSSYGNVNVDTACSPGQFASGEAYVQTSGMVASGSTLTPYILYLDSVGNQLAAFNTGAISTELSTFTLVGVSNVQQPAPPGTAKCRLNFDMSPGSGSSKTMLIALPVLTVQ